jgi:hypothetical protein
LKNNEENKKKNKLKNIAETEGGPKTHQLRARCCGVNISLVWV